MKSGIKLTGKGSRITVVRLGKERDVLFGLTAWWEEHALEALSL